MFGVYVDINFVEFIVRYEEEGYISFIGNSLS